MNTLIDTSAAYSTHRGPHPGTIALAHVALFMTRLLMLGILTKGEGFPNPYGSIEKSQAALLKYLDIIRISTVLQFGAAIPLAIFTAAVTSRLHFLGVKVTGVTIALVDGIRL